MHVVCLGSVRKLPNARCLEGGTVSASVCEEPLEENLINLPGCCGLRRVKGRRVLGSGFDG